MQSGVSTETITLANQNVLHIFTRGLAGPAPTIILYHGWFGRGMVGTMQQWFERWISDEP